MISNLFKTTKSRDFNQLEQHQEISRFQCMKSSNFKPIHITKFRAFKLVQISKSRDVKPIRITKYHDFNVSKKSKNEIVARNQINSKLSHDFNKYLYGDSVCIQTYQFDTGIKLSCYMLFLLLYSILSCYLLSILPCKYLLAIYLSYTYLLYSYSPYHLIHF